MRLVVLLLLLSTLAPAHGAEDDEESRAPLAARLRDVTPILARHVDDPSDKHDAALEHALESAWALLGQWTSGFLDRHPHASAAALLLDLSHATLSSDLDAGLSSGQKLSATAVELRGGTHAAYAVAPFLAGHGTFFVVARDGASGRFALRWSVVPLAAAYGDTSEAIRRWAISGAGGRRPDGRPRDRPAGRAIRSPAFHDRRARRFWSRMLIHPPQHLEVERQRSAAAARRRLRRHV